jgi:hypothetical protein
MMNDDDERLWTLYYGFGMEMELWLSREYFFYKGIKNWLVTGYERESAGGNQTRLELGFCF